MTSTQPTLQWSESQPAEEVRTSEQLDQLVDRLAGSTSPDSPISVRLHAYGCEADILLGLAETCVYVTDVAARRYYTTVGDLYFDDVVSFLLLGQHHTEFECRHLIPLATARSVFREFFDTGHRSAAVKWEEGWY